MRFFCCYCQKKKEKVWKKFCERLSQVIEEKIELFIPEHPQQADEFFPKQGFPDIGFFNFPICLCKVYKENYFIFAKINFKKIHNFYLLSRVSFDQLKEAFRKEEKIPIGFRSSYTLLGALVVILGETFEKTFSLSSLIPIESKDLEKLVSQFLRGDLKILLLTEEDMFSFQTFKNIPENIYKYPLKFPYHYYIGIKFSLKNREKIKNEILKLLSEFKEDLEIVDISEVNEEKRVTLFGYCALNEFIEEGIEAYHNVRFLLSTNAYGVLIYREKYEYANSYVCKLLGYSLKELKSFKPEDIAFYEEDKKKIREIAKRRILGEYFEGRYYRFALKTKEGSKVEVLAYSTTLLYQKDYAGFVIIVDITEEEKLKKFYELLKDVNQILITCTYEEEVWEKILPVLQKSLNLKGGWLGKLEPGGIIRFVKGIANTKRILEELDLLQNGILDIDTTPLISIKTAVKEREVYIVDYIQDFPYSEKVKRYAEEKGIKSICVIPLFKRGEVAYILSLWSEEPYFFTQKMKEIIKELQQDLSFVLEKIEFLHYSRLINEFISHSDEFFIITDPYGNIQHYNQAFLKIFGKSVLSGKNLITVFPEVYPLMRRLSSKEEVRGIVYYHKGEERIPLEVEAKKILLPGEDERIIFLGKDISKEVKWEEEKRRVQAQDFLTGLLNNYGFLSTGSELTKKFQMKGALLLLDIKDFSLINHSLGRKVGDECLKVIAKRLQSVVGKNGFIGRVRDDTFALFYFNLEKSELVNWLSQIESLLSRAVVIEDKKLELKFYGSVLYYPDDASSFEELYEKAFIVLKRVKAQKEPKVVVFNPVIEDAIQKFISAKLLIEKAFEEDLFVFYYQPYVRVSDLSVAGFEALVRIELEGKVVPPIEFIDFLEESPYLKKFESLTLKKNIQALKELDKPVSINITLKGLETGHFFAALSEVEEELKSLKVPLGIELTERQFGEDIEKIKKNLELLKSYNIILAIDDFGTGYSSLKYLKELPVDVLKIDKSFIWNLKDEKDYALLKGIINLSKSLGIKVLAEGVEEEAQYKLLKELDCDFLQGYYFSPPVPLKKAKNY